MAGDDRCADRAAAAAAAVQDLSRCRGGHQRGGRGRGRHEQHDLAHPVPLEVRVFERPVELSAVERERHGARLDASEDGLEVASLPGDLHVLRLALSRLHREGQVERRVGRERLLDLLSR